MNTLISPPSPIAVQRTRVIFLLAMAIAAFCIFPIHGEFGRAIVFVGLIGVTAIEAVWPLCSRTLAKLKPGVPITRQAWWVYFAQGTILVLSFWGSGPFFLAEGKTVYAILNAVVGVVAVVFGARKLILSRTMNIANQD